MLTHDHVLNPFPSPGCSIMLRSSVTHLDYSVLKSLFQQSVVILLGGQAFTLTVGATITLDSKCPVD